MTQENYIVDTQLPLELDFKALKAAGLAYIQKHSSNEWTNLNPSDPGVTILEQLCYAFTELGYCGNFPMKDILTDKKGDLTVADQFYLPQNILTTSPVTVNDYTKYIIDQIVSVKNVVITPISLKFPFINGFYEVYLLLDPNEKKTASTDASETNEIIENETFYLLNSCRNVGEFFLKPTVLAPKEYTIAGELILESDADFDSVMSEIIQNINAYIFPDVVQTGYDKLKAAGVATNDIFNGPTLDNGWISSESIQPKKDSIQAFEITKLIQEVTGVQSISKVSFTCGTKTLLPAATCKIYEILTFNFSQSLLNQADASNLQVNTQGKSLNASLNMSLMDELAMMQQTNSQVNEVASVQMAPTVPKGKYRDITSYYSIQNTFPEAYAVGLNATNDSMPAYQIAQSRQLKGYLSLFDQVLSNQFAQLANIDKLFSFKNAITGAPADLEHYNNIKTPAQKANPAYPAPFEVFSPTYFYQSLYNSVPNAAPLLRDNSIFNFGPVSESDATLAHKSWLAYQDDPYNSYMYGLLVYNEDDTVNLQRRNDLLDHLLARHGESPLIMDTLIYGTVYSGDFLKDRVIIKSMYLQNLGILSYNRTKAYNSIGALLLNEFTLTITAALIDYLESNKPLETEEEASPTANETQQQIANLKATYRARKMLRDILTKNYKHEGYFETNRINEEEKITSLDSLNYTTISLKLSMLLTLKPLYINFVQYTLDFNPILKTPDKISLAYEQSEMAIWLLTERKGMIAIETNLLLQSGSFQIYIQENTDDKMYYCFSTMLNYDDFVLISTVFNSAPSEGIISYLKETYPNHILTAIDDPSKLDDATFTTIENAAYSWTATVSWDDGQNTMYITDPFLANTLLWMFPDYIPELATPDWQHRLSYFMESQLPIQITAHPMYATADNLKTIIPQYVRWFNANIYNTTTQTIDQTAVTKAAADLITTLKLIYNNQVPTNA
ncbi:MAG: hypothetical protein AB8B65_07080 [Kordia sp.]|uniref:hypothetical protein n=1 Tax=Kordia sp. TaxID=1965332 RepID=UPI00385A4F0F